MKLMSLIIFIMSSILALGFFVGMLATVLYNYDVKLLAGAIIGFFVFGSIASCAFVQSIWETD